MKIEKRDSGSYRVRKTIDKHVYVMTFDHKPTQKEVNEELQDNPAMINSDPYGAWIAKIVNITGCEELMTAAEYAASKEA